MTVRVEQAWNGDLSLKVDGVIWHHTNWFTLNTRHSCNRRPLDHHSRRGIEEATILHIDKPTILELDDSLTIGFICP